MFKLKIFKLQSQIAQTVSEDESSKGEWEQLSVEEQESVVGGGVRNGYDSYVGDNSNVGFGFEGFDAVGRFRVNW